ncbi:Peroxisomal membrane protein PEX28 [Candida viswanathii]|uniref:Peroxisomal membrane protein PEX28 n=1 Tax=Candida viswanathii TaxID=5486 RepID=A0A367XVE7_9ASCO|nr:Peroxisomal membrane protein PEX28 [Candida viswanathii]
MDSSSDQPSDTLQQSPSISSSTSASSYRDYAVGKLNLVVAKGNRIAESKPGSKRAFAINTASSLLEKGYDRYNNSNSNGGNSRRNRSGSYDLTDEQISHIEAMADSADAEKQPKTNHFADRMIEKLLKSVLPQDIPERELFEKRLNDPDRNKRPGLSLTVLASNVKQMAGKMTNFFAVQYEVMRIISWKQPSKTISVLVLYTAACMWPHLVLAYPLMFVLFGVLIPGFVYRHPMRNPDLIKVKRRGQSLWSFLFDSPDTSIVEDLINEDYLREDAEVASSTYSVSEEVSEAGVSTSQAESDTSGGGDASPKKDTARHRKSQVALLINLRDFQNLTTDILKGVNEAEKFYYETAGFKDERLSTFIFYGVLVATFGILFVGQFIPWRLIFIQAGWGAGILSHPKCKKFLVDASKARKQKALLAKLNAQANEPEPTPEIIVEDTDHVIKQFDRNDIIVDDSPEVRVVEVWELQIKSILKHSWSFYRYSNTIYDKNNKSRVAGKRPSGVDKLSKVYPPVDWKFDFGLVNKWNLDTDPAEFIRERSLNPSLFIIKEGEKDGWIYDNMEGVVHLDIIYEFRRRRLSRECYRYGRPPKEPSKY